MIAIISSMRGPRRFHCVPVTSKSSGQGLSPTPKQSRSPISATSELTCFATSTGWRIGSLITNVVRRSRRVTAPIAAISTKGSMNGLPSMNSRVPSWLYGYFVSERAG